MGLEHNPEGLWCWVMIVNDATVPILAACGLLLRTLWSFLIINLC